MVQVSSDDESVQSEPASTMGRRREGGDGHLGPASAPGSPSGRGISHHAGATDFGLLHAPGGGSDAGSLASCLSDRSTQYGSLMSLYSDATCDYLTANEGDDDDDMLLGMDAYGSR